MATPAPSLSPAHSPFASLAYRQYRLYWAGTAVKWAGTQMQQVAVAWQVYSLTHSPLALGLTGLFRVVPVILLSLGAGVVADTLDRRRLLLATQSTLMLMSASLATLTLTGRMTIWLLYGIITLAAIANAFDGPARQAVIPALVPREVLANALSLNSTSQQVSSVLGPSVAGIIIALSGVGAVYVVDVVSFLSVLTVLLIIRLPVVRGGLQRVSLAAALEGLAFVFSTPIILSTMGIDFVATFFGSATQLLPIFARDILHVGSRGYGILYAAPSVGAVLSGIGMSLLVSRIRRQGLVIILAVMAYALATIVFGLSHLFWLSFLALAGTGAADTVSMILRQTIRQLTTPDAMRGRMTAVGMIFFMGGPQLGEFEAGVVARAFGAPLSVISGGIAAVLATGLIAAAIPRLRQYRD